MLAAGVWVAAIYTYAVVMLYKNRAGLLPYLSLLMGSGYTAAGNYLRELPAQVRVIKPSSAGKFPADDGFRKINIR